MQICRFACTNCGPCLIEHDSRIFGKNLTNFVFMLKYHVFTDLDSGEI